MSADWKALLKTNYLFQSIPDRSFESLASAGRTRNLVAGEFLIRGGERNHNLFVVLDGLFEVILADPSDKTRPLRLALCEPGEAIGELSLMDSQPANASVRAVEPARVFELDHADLRSLIEADAATGVRLMGNMLTHLVHRLRRESSEVLQARVR